MEVNGKTAVVTGGGNGIGRAIAIALARKNANVGIADINFEEAAAVSRELKTYGVKTHAFACDVASEEQVETLAQSSWDMFGSVDLLFNNAGVSGGTTLLESSTDDLRWVFSVNVFGVWHGIKSFGRRFREQGSPSWIVNTGSEHCFSVPHLGGGFYTAGKHAVLGLSDVLRRELPPHMGVSVLCPGLTVSRLWHADRNRPSNYGGPGQENEFARSVMERGMDPLEVGRQAVAGVEREDFLIVTHPHARTFAEERYRDVMDAFDAQAPYKEGDDRYDVNKLLERP